MLTARTFKYRHGLTDAALFKSHLEDYYSTIVFSPSKFGTNIPRDSIFLDSNGKKFCPIGLLSLFPITLWEFNLKPPSPNHWTMKPYDC
ncbi:hypothetical protein CEXT_518621 [Caerostris extrusa]|uniref:Uncharacterized protein n=1 Tax=Caerostris extrusa TaxID=172846 RepID=A0AAV4TZ43_CAEEX|nr:hypothetical protein CEXT_518621 [Caerostris extrusa]